jgi:2,3-bisphosphoglycerate-dependent phosphoglycerate mutase
MEVYYHYYCICTSFVILFTLLLLLLLLFQSCNNYYIESTWNQENKFTGWYDCPLSEKGNIEAINAGKLLAQNGYKFDVAYTSLLKRAIRTLWHSLEQTDSMYIPIHNSWQLNERHYGALQGLDKQETVQKFGKDQVNLWRRSYDIPPPECDVNSSHCPANDPKYMSIPEARTIKTESLKVIDSSNL